MISVEVAVIPAADIPEARRLFSHRDMSQNGMYSRVSGAEGYGSLDPAADVTIGLAVNRHLHRPRCGAVLSEFQRLFTSTLSRSREFTQMPQQPFFPFYASDYLSSSKVQSMPVEAEGAYIRLLSYNWKDGSIPDDPEKLAPLCKMKPRRMAVVWDCYLKFCFVPNGEPGRLVNRKLEEVRANYEKFRERRREAGQRGGLAKASNARNLLEVCQPDATSKSCLSLSLSHSLSKEEIKPSLVLPLAAKPKRAGTNTKIPDEFSVTSEMNAWATAEGFSFEEIRRETAKMIDHFRGNGKRHLDWAATWRNWMRNHRDGKFSGKFSGGSNGRSYESPAQGAARRTREAAERLRARTDSEIERRVSGGVNGRDAGHLSLETDRDSTDETGCRD